MGSRALPSAAAAVPILMSRTEPSGDQLPVRPTPSEEENVSSVAICASLPTGGEFVPRVNVTASVSPDEMPGVTGGGFPAMADTTPGQHVAAPGADASGGVHGVHAQRLVAFVAALDVPAGHGAHAAALAPPSAELYVPAGQGSSNPLAHQ